MERTSSGPYHPASSISFSSGTISPPAQSAVNPTIREWGKGQGWLPK